jgi:hypothetical protein
MEVFSQNATLPVAFSADDGVMNCVIAYQGTFLISLHLRYALTRSDGFADRAVVGRCIVGSSANSSAIVLTVAPRALEFIKLLTKNAGTPQTRL